MKEEVERVLSSVRSLPDRCSLAARWSVGESFSQNSLESVGAKFRRAHRALKSVTARALDLGCGMDGIVSHIVSRILYLPSWRRLTTPRRFN